MQKAARLISAVKFSKNILGSEVEAFLAYCDVIKAF